LIGLISNIALNVIALYYGGLDNTGRLPSWALHLCSILYFSYYILDNLDGKQARRTKSSSELGMLMDHSCDAVTTFIFSIGLSTIVGCDSPMLYFVLWSMTTIPFFFTTLEAYYLGILRLGYLNGASEGTIFACLFMSAAGFTGIV
jgi:ethanolaminephosphotransferase